MRGTLKKCDQCGKEVVKMEGTIGGTMPTSHWITVNRGESTSGQKIHAGTTDFCSDKCLCEYLSI